jgi:hypothetical protein
MFAANLYFSGFWTEVRGSFFEPGCCRRLPAPSGRPSGRCPLLGLILLGLIGGLLRRCAVSLLRVCLLRLRHLVLVFGCHRVVSLVP